MLTPQTVHAAVAGTLARCISNAGITAGHYGEDFTTTLSCATFLAPARNQAASVGRWTFELALSIVRPDARGHACARG